MSRYLCIFVVLLLFPVLTVVAQESAPVPRRTAEERAMKQTEMLVRDLEITDTVLRDTLYQVHLRYVHRREQVSSRAEAVECVNQLLAELKSLITPAQYERLESIPRRQGARVHRVVTDTLYQDATQPTP